MMTSVATIRMSTITDLEIMSFNVDRLMELRFYVPLNTKIGLSADVLSSQSLGIVLKKLNLTQPKKTMQEQNSLN